MRQHAEASLAVICRHLTELGIDQDLRILRDPMHQLPKHSLVVVAVGDAVTVLRCVWGAGTFRLSWLAVAAELGFALHVARLAAEGAFRRANTHMFWACVFTATVHTKTDLDRMEVTRLGATAASRQVPGNHVNEACELFWVRVGSIAHRM